MGASEILCFRTRSRFEQRPQPFLQTRSYDRWDDPKQLGPHAGLIYSCGRPWKTSMMNMKNTLLVTCMTLTLIVSSSASSLAGELTGRGEQMISETDPCVTNCKNGADYCREQCSHPEEPEQCIVACSRSECNDSCNKFEDACTRRCQSPKG